MLLKKAKVISLLGQWEEFAPRVLKSLRSIEGLAHKSLERRKRAFQGWVVKIAVIGLSVFMSLAFLVLGLFFIAMDYGGVPRGVVFTCGGLLGLLILRLMVPSAK